MTTKTKKETIPLLDDTFAIATFDKGMVSVTGYRLGDTGLAFRPCCNGYYVGCHLKSGLKLGPTHFTKINAERFLRGLARLPIDWTSENPDVKPFSEQVHHLRATYQVFTNWDH